MNVDIIGAIICGIIGIGVAFVNYLIGKFTLMKYPDRFSAVTVVRQAVQIVFLVLVYFVGQKTAPDTVYLLVGAVIGMTIPMFVFTKKLVNLNEAFNNKEKGKEEDKNG